MKTNTKTILGIVIFAAFLGIVYSAYTILSNNYKPNNKTQIAEDSSKRGNEKIPAPDFTIFDAKGNEVKLSDFAGKPVVLNFWASWCPPCKMEMPHFDKIHAEVKDKIVFMMIDMVDGERETQAKGQKYIEDQGYSLPIYFDNEQDAAYTYAISSIPTTFFIDADGNIITAYQGPIDEETLIAAIGLIQK